MFRQLSWRTGAAHEDDGPFSSRISLWDAGALALGERESHFGFVSTGQAKIKCRSGEFLLQQGMYFCVPGNCEIAGDGKGLVASRIGFDGFFHLGGPIETTGRLRYIDGCSDSLLISPVVCGDPCLNLLHIPPGTNQTQHTHPTLRAGVIVHGEGICKTLDQVFALSSGMAFVISAETQHSFHTSQETLLVVAWHPDSDSGPSHDDHPMVNRTIVDGVPASKIPEIRT